MGVHWLCVSQRMAARYCRFNDGCQQKKTARSQLILYSPYECVSLYSGMGHDLTVLVGPAVE